MRRTDAGLIPVATETEFRRDPVGHVLAFAGRYDGTTGGYLCWRGTQIADPDVRQDLRDEQILGEGLVAKKASTLGRGPAVAAAAAADRDSGKSGDARGARRGPRQQKTSPVETHDDAIVLADI